MRKSATTSPLWRQPDGKPVSCVEKLKVLDQNLAEIRMLSADALEDGVLMGCDPDQIRAVLHEIIEALPTPYAKK